MTRKRDPRGASRRGADHSDLGYGVDAPAPLAQYVPPAQAGVPCVAMQPCVATFSDGTQRVIVPLGSRVIGAGGAIRRRVVEIESPEFVPMTYERLEF